MPVSILRCVTTFDAMVDVDLGLVILVLDEFNNPEFLIEGIDKIKYNLTTLRVLLADRDLENPLSIILKPELEEHFDSLRDQFFDAYYDQILSLSGETSVARLLATASMTQQLTDSTVYCKSQQEIDYINKLNVGVKAVLSSGSILPSEGYSAFYLKRMSDVTLFEPIRGKSITVMEYKFNLDHDPSVFNMHLPKDEYLKLVGESNSIYTIPVYPGLELPEE